MLIKNLKIEKLYYNHKNPLDKSGFLCYNRTRLKKGEKMGNLIDLTNQIFGDYKVTGFDNSKGKKLEYNMIRKIII